MKFPIAILVLSGTVMVVLIFQAVRQELDLQSLKSRMADSVEEVNGKEEAISDVKSRVTELKTTLTTLNVNVEELKKMKTEAEKSTDAFDKSLQTCNTEKATTLRKKTDIEGIISQLKVTYEAAKVAAEGEVQSLRKQILDRDRAICAFVDMSKQEARDLCDNLIKSP